MAVSVKVDIRNKAQIATAFRKAPFVMTQQLDRAIQKSVFTISRQSRINSPVDTGRLRASHREKIGRLRGQVSTNVQYDIFVHEGTRFQRPQPYMRDAVEDRDQEIQRFFTQAVKKALNKTVR